MTKTDGIWRMLQVIGFLSVGIGLPIHSTHAADVVGTASVVDGDTLDIHGIRIRLQGVDAPESSQSCQDLKGQPWRCGQQAALALSDHLGRNTVTCVPNGTVSHERIVADCFLAGASINQWLVQQGWAMDSPKYSKGAYAKMESEAHQSKLGIWSGAIEPPWKYRARMKKKRS